MRTKIICTIGPNTESPEMIEELIKAGMTIARLNFSHDIHETHGKRIDLVREIAKRLDKEVKILVDLQGPKIRVREFENPPIRLEADDVVVLTTSSAPEIGTGEIVIEDPYLHEDVSTGDPILIDDGLIQLVAESVEDHKIIARVMVGGDLYPRKGVNIPYTQTTTSSITDKDITDLKFALTKNPDWVAISFVQNAVDVTQVKELIGDNGARVMCKIERAKAIDNLAEIVRASDGVMVARGDLGVEIPFERLPIIQKSVIHYCNDVGKPVVTATQMLATMIHNPFPTRAETSDIANAVIDGTDAVMLSNETAVGDYPVEAVKVMHKIVNETEKFIFGRENKL